MLDAAIARDADALADALAAHYVATARLVTIRARSRVSASTACVRLSPRSPREPCMRLVSGDCLSGRGGAPVRWAQEGSGAAGPGERSPAVSTATQPGAQPGNTALTRRCSRSSVTHPVRRRGRDRRHQLQDRAGSGRRPDRSQRRWQDLTGGRPHGRAPPVERTCAFRWRGRHRPGRAPLARRGMTRTFQSVELFDDMNVEENLLVAAERPRCGGRWRRCLHRSRDPGPRLLPGLPRLSKSATSSDGTAGASTRTAQARRRRSRARGTPLVAAARRARRRSR